MILWVDAQLPPKLAAWLTDKFDVEAVAVRDVGLRDARDREIYRAAAEAGAVVITKDSDFVYLLRDPEPRPQVIWMTCGNTSNQRLEEILSRTLPAALRLLAQGEPLVEISDAR